MNTLINSAKATALLSFIIGTAILALHLTLKDMLIGGFIFTIIAIIINIIVLLSLLILAIFNNEYRFELFKTSGMILLNIPVALFYFYIVVTLTNPIL